jgi:hypothetical protein
MTRNRLREILCNHLEVVIDRLPQGADKHIAALREHEHGTFVAMTATIDAMEAAIKESQQ